MKNDCKFKPRISDSEKSYNQGLKETQTMLRRAAVQDPFENTQPSQVVVKGLNNHISRIAIAKNRKLQEQEAFLLPSQKKQLQKIREQQNAYMQENQFDMDQQNMMLMQE